MDVMPRNLPRDIIKSKQVRQSTCNVTFRHVRATTVAVGKQLVRGLEL